MAANFLEKEQNIVLFHALALQKEESARLKAEAEIRHSREARKEAMIKFRKKRFWSRLIIAVCLAAIVFSFLVAYSMEGQPTLMQLFGIEFSL